MVVPSVAYSDILDARVGLSVMGRSTKYWSKCTGQEYLVGKLREIQLRGGLMRTD